MNTDGDGFITWKNGLSNNEIATRLAESQAAVNALAAEAATPEYQAAQAAEQARIAASLAQFEATGRRPSL
jgi:ribosome-binding protein aMBF1 (putative translation factor)